MAEPLAERNQGVVASSLSNGTYYTTCANKKNYIFHHYQHQALKRLS